MRHFKETFWWDIMMRHIDCLSRTALHCTALHCTALNCTAMHWTLLKLTALHCTELYCTALYCTKLHCTALHWTALHCIALCQKNAKQWGTSSKKCQQVDYIVLVLLSAHIRRVSVSRVRDFKQNNSFGQVVIQLKHPVSRVAEVSILGTRFLTSPQWLTKDKNWFQREGMGGKDRTWPSWGEGNNT